MTWVVLYSLLLACVQCYRVVPEYPCASFDALCSRFNLEQVIPRASFERASVRKGEDALFVCQYGPMINFNRSQAIISFPHGGKYFSHITPAPPPGINITFDARRNAFVVRVLAVELEDAGKYSCYYALGGDDKVTLIDSETRERSNTLTVMVPTSPPKIDGPYLHPVRAGQQVNLTCTVLTSLPGASVTWWGDGHQLRQRPVTTHTPYPKAPELMTSTSVLTLTPSREQDRKEIFCRAINDADLTPKNASVVLDVRYEPTVRVSMWPSLVDSEVSKVTLTCSWDANPALRSFRWFIDDTRLNETSSKLELHGVSKATHKDKVVRCEASNGIGDTASDFTTLQFVEKPEFVEEPAGQSVVLGDAFELHCAAKGVPEPRIEWKRQGYDKVIATGRTLSVHPARYTDTGVYVCRAIVHNTYTAESAARVDVFGRPSLLAERTKYSRVGGMATLQCSVSTRVTNPLRFFWTHHDQTFEEGQFLDKYLVEKKVLNESWTLLLTILDLKEENFGDYNCTAYNMAGDSTVTVALMQPQEEQAEFSLMMLGLCVAGALLLVTTTILASAVCYCKAGKGETEQKCDMPPSYRVDMSSGHTNMSGGQDYVDMEGMMGGGGGGGGGGGPSPPPVGQHTMHMYPAFFGGSRSELSDDICKAASCESRIRGADDDDQSLPSPASILARQLSLAKAAAAAQTAAASNPYAFCHNSEHGSSEGDSPQVRPEQSNSPTSTEENFDPPAAALYINQSQQPRLQPAAAAAGYRVQYVAVPKHRLHLVNPDLHPADAQLSLDNLVQRRLQEPPGAAAGGSPVSTFKPAGTPQYGMHKFMFPQVHVPDNGSLRRPSSVITDQGPRMMQTFLPSPMRQRLDSGTCYSGTCYSDTNEPLLAIQSLKEKLHSSRSATLRRKAAAPTGGGRVRFDENVASDGDVEDSDNSEPSVHSPLNPSSAAQKTPGGTRLI